MTDSISALLVGNQNDSQLISVITRDLDISSVSVVNKANEALETIKFDDSYTVVFVDHDFLQEEAFSFTRAAYETNKCENTQFFLLAKAANKDLLRKASNCGFSAFVRMPFEKKALIKKIEKYVPALNKVPKKRINLLESIEATLRFKNKEIIGAIRDISDDGCLVQTLRTDRLGMEIYDIVTIRIEFDNEKFGINGEVVRMEKDNAMGDKAISTAFKFTKPDDKNALLLAKFWAYLLKERHTN